jgi:aminopeptidase YwaD
VISRALTFKVRPMQRLNEIADAILDEVSGLEAYNYLKIITSFHRVQISDGLIEACKTVTDLIKEHSEIANVKLYFVSSEEVPSWLQVPPFWTIKDAWVEVGDDRISLREHPTLVTVHSPPTEGIVKGKVKIIRRWWDPKEYKDAKDKIIITNGNRAIAYKLAQESNALAVAFYRENAPETAVPYTSLFLDYDIIVKNPIPAISLPYKLVKSIEGKEVKIYVESELKPNPQIPFVCARLGEEKKSGPLIVSHICHPAPGANDNASGSASNLEALLALTRLIKKSKLREPDTTIRFLWVPEYTGSIAALETILKGKVTQVINLDMVGVEPGGEEGPLHLYLSSSSALGDVDLISYLFLIKITEKLGVHDYEVEPYSAGSDHDVFIAYGIPGVMLIQWPDTRYHTDEDDVNRISKRMLKLAASVALSSAYILSARDRIISRDEVKRFRRWFLEKLRLKRLSEGDLLGASLIGSLVSKHYGLEELDKRPSLDVKLPKNKPRRKVPIVLGARQFIKKDFERAIELSKILESGDLDAYTLYLMEPFFLMNGERNLDEIYGIIRGLYQL